MSSRESRLCHRIVVALVAPLAACGMHSGEGTQTSAAPSHQAAGQTLYQRLGGKPAITAVVDDFVGNVAADPRINQRFAGADIPRLKRMLVEQICQTSGGPCTYVGRDMRTAHAGMDITDAEIHSAGPGPRQIPGQVQRRGAGAEGAADRTRRYEGRHRRRVTELLVVLEYQR